MGIQFAYAADIVKSERNELGDLVVYGKATGPDLDLDGQVCDPKWLQKAMPEWMTFGNIREMHQPIAAGIGTELTQQGDDWWLKSVCVDPNTARKIEAKVLTGYSVGIKDAKVVKDASAPGGRIVGGTIVETSYVDRPCNPTAKMAIAKAAGATGVLEAVEADIEKRDYSAAERKEMASKGQAQSDGSWPIADRADVVAAVRSIGRSDNPSRDKAWIKRRAAAVGASDAIPDSWKIAEGDLNKTAETSAPAPTGGSGDTGTLSAKGDDGQPGGAADVAAADPMEGGQEGAAESADKSLARGVGRTILTGLKTLKSATGQALLTKAAPDEDIASAEACMSAIGALIAQEAQGLVDGLQCEAYQIECLLRAYNALVYFCALEASEPDEEGETVTVISLGSEADVTKNEPKPETEAAKTETTEATPSAEASKLQERVKALEAQLAKVLETPRPGGPVLTRKAEDIERADQRVALLAKAARFDQLATDMQASDPAAARGYRELAASMRSGA